MAQALGSLLPMGEAWIEFLVLAWPSPSCHSHLHSDSSVPITLSKINEMYLLNALFFR